MNLPNRIHDEVVTLSAKGDALVEQARFDEALVQFEAAFRILPAPKEDWQAATWLLAAIGDAYFLAGNFEAAQEALSHAMRCPDAIGNPFLHLRLGQCRLVLGDEAKAADELTRAYAMGGVEVFETEDPKFLRFLDTKIQR